MNTTSKPRRLFLGLAAVAASATVALVACIQGPWDYYPDNPPVFRGIFVTGYALAGKPVQHLCFERVLGLSEEATQAFAFYDSADVRLAGRFSGEPSNLVLTAIADTPNCFKGDSLSLVEKGENYDLTARISWDSAGEQVTSVLTATARVPERFDLHTDASAPSFAKTGGVPDDIFTPGFFFELPPNVRETLSEENPQLVTLLFANPPDTAALEAYILANGKRIQERLVDLLGKDNFIYNEGDTLFYLNGALNTLSHYFSADRSEDVKAVLISQRYEDTSSRPETRFDSPLGLEPDSSDYYFIGTSRRLLLYQDAKANGGYNLLDSMGVVNVWFHTLRNRLYFYGFEQAYFSYYSTVLEDGGNPRIKPKYNVQGGRGIFAGAVPDSFDVYIKTDSLTKSYPLPLTRAFTCREDGWQDSQDCRGYYRSYCSERDWEPADCRQDAVTACLEAEADGDTALQARCAPRADAARQDTALTRRGESRFCIERNFPAGNPACEVPTQRCLETQGSNACKQALWNFCLDNNWRPEQCAPGLASYCHDKPRLSETLCKRADTYCEAHPGSVLCK